MAKYYIEVAKPSGFKTHFGRDDEERYEPLHKLPDNLGYDHRVDAEKEIPRISEWCKKMGMMVSSIVVVKKED